MIFGRAKLSLTSRYSFAMFGTIAVPRFEPFTSRGALHQAGEVVGHDLRLDGGLEARDDAVGRLGPAHVAQHHLAGEDHRAGVDLVLAGVLGRRAVRGLEQRVARSRS